MHDDLIVENFAGGGGAGEGIFQALGRQADIAINHDNEALALNQANHPNTRFYQEDVFDVDPMLVTRGKAIKLAWFSPDCKHFSKAKGGKPVEKKIRGLAWVTLKWAAHKRPPVILLENVEEFLDWGPLHPDDHPDPMRRSMPIKEYKGRTYQAFVSALTTGLSEDHPDAQEIYEVLGGDFDMTKLYAGLGYIVDYRVICAADYGTPTIRKRLFLQARCDGIPITWPEPTHYDPKSKKVSKEGKLPWIPAHTCIDWSIPIPSIFGRKKDLADKTLARICKGIVKFVIEAEDPFIAPVGSAFMTEHANGSSQRNFDIDEPMRTQCAEVKGGHFALVSASLTQIGYGEREGQAPRALDITKPLGTVVSSGKHALVCASLIKHYTGVVGTEVTVPFGTVTTADHHSVLAVTLDKPIVTSHIMKMRGTNIGHSMDEPIHTISAGGTHHAEVRAFLIKYHGDGGQWADARDPMHTVVTNDSLALVVIKGEQYVISDVGMRMLVPRELARAQGFPEHYKLEIVVNGKKLSKKAQVRMIGNSVCPPLAKAIVANAFKHQQLERKTA